MTNRIRVRDSRILGCLLAACVASLVAMIPHARLFAQGPGAGGGAREPVVLSVRPILVDIEFEGNDAIATDRLLARIQTRATHVPLVKRYYSMLVDLLEQNPLAPTEYQKVGRDYQVLPPYYQLRRIVDSLGGDIRYLNMARLDSDVVRLRTLYFDNGFHDADIDYHIRLDTVRNTSIVRFIINEHQRYPLRAVTYVGLDQVPNELRANLIRPDLIELGRGFSKADLEAETSRIVADLKNNGYPFAVSRTPLILVARERDSIPGAPYDSALVFIFTGHRYRMGQTVFAPDSNYDDCMFDDSLVLAQAEYVPGEWYSKRQVDQSTENIYSLGSFDLVSFDTVNVNHADSIMGMRINTRTRSRNDIRWGLNVGYVQRVTEFLWIAGGDASYTRYNAFCSGGHLTVGGHLSIPLTNFGRFPYLFNQGEGGGNASMLFPSIFGRRRLLGSVGVSYDNKVVARQITQANAEFTMRGQAIELGGDLVVRFPKYTFFSVANLHLAFQRNSYQGVARLINAVAETRARTAADGDAACDYNSLRSALRAELANTTYRLQVLQGDDPSLLQPGDSALLNRFNSLKQTVLLTAIATADGRDDAFLPTKGYILDARVELGTSFGADIFAKLETNARLYKPGLGGTFAFRGRAGYIINLAGYPLIPQSSRFFAGGANSMRAWVGGDLLATRRTTSAVVNDSCTAAILQSLVADNRRAQGGLGQVEFNAEWRVQPWQLESQSTVAQQLNQLVLIGFVDVGSAFFRDVEDIGQVNVLSNIGMDIGASVGYQTPVGPFRIGVAAPIHDPLQTDPRQRWITNRQFTSALLLHIGIGHAF